MKKRRKGENNKLTKENTQKIDYDKLVQQDRVDSIFNPILEKFGNHKEEIKELEFLFKNCCYNESRLMAEIERSREGISFPDEETKKKTAQTIGLKKVGDRAEVGIPTTFQADIMTFELHALLSNIVRCCNYFTKFKLKNVDKVNKFRTITIGGYYGGKLKYLIKNRSNLHQFLRNQFDEWIKKLNKIRNEIIHEHIVREMRQDLIFIWKIIPGGSIDTKGDIKLAISEYNIGNLERYVTETVIKLELFIKEFFNIYGQDNLKESQLN